LNRFALQGGLEPALREIELVSGSFNPFAIHFDRVVCDRHWLDPDLRAVFLTSSSTDEEGSRTLLELHDTVSAELATLIRDVQPKLRERPYVPHLSLTSGMPEPDASRLSEAARVSGLKLKFRVENISLLEFVTGPSGKEQMRRARSFVLAGPHA
jgi:2'-5' RNA ligase